MNKKQDNINKLVKKFNDKNYSEVENDSDILRREDKDEPFYSNIYALSLSMQGQKDKAINVFNENTKKFPYYVLSYFNLARIYSEKDESKKTIALFNKSIEIDPRFIDSYIYLADYYISRNLFDDAKKVSKKCIDSNPENTSGYTSYSKICLFKNNYDEAIKFSTKAIDLDSNNFYAFMIKGVAQHSLGEYQKALISYENSISLNKFFPDLYNNYGVTLSKLNRNIEAIEAFKKSISLNDKFPEAIRNLAKEYAIVDNPSVNFALNYDRFNKALLLINKSLSLKPDYIDGLRTKSLILLNLNKYDDALNIQKKLIKLDSANVVDFCNLGVLYQNLGDIELAKDSFKKAIKSDSNYTPSFRYLSGVTSYKFDDPYINIMEEKLSSKSLDDDMQMQLFFALSKAYEDIGNFDKALNFINKANEKLELMFPYDINSLLETSSQIKKTFSSNYMNSLKESGIMNSKLIFIIGMPRSGTTLVEQILSSHSIVQGGGELDFFENCLRKNFNGKPMLEIINNFQNSSDDILSLIGDDYLKMIGNLRNKDVFITDKMPTNFKYIGIIMKIFPDAKVIHCQRDPYDTCISNYKNYFNAKSMGYTNNMDNLISYYNNYQRLIKHWEKLPYIDYLSIKYEDLISDQKSMTEQILKYCNLDWEDNCLDFYKNKRVVNTASHYQVRQKINNKSVGFWKNYESLFMNYDKDVFDIN
tara:strand:- start:1699 stop:3804 length:2106 start_codon:yes stop_codon:yes gene_type:complete